MPPVTNPAPGEPSNCSPRMSHSPQCGYRAESCHSLDPKAVSPFLSMWIDRKWAGNNSFQPTFHFPKAVVDTGHVLPSTSHSPLAPSHLPNLSTTFASDLHTSAWDYYIMTATAWDSQVSLPRNWIKNCFAQWVERVFRLYERYIRGNSRARKRETTKHNTAKLAQPKPSIYGIGLVLRHVYIRNVKVKIVNYPDSASVGCSLLAWLTDWLTD